MAENTYEQVRETVCRAVMEKVDYSRETPDEEIYELIDSCIVAAREEYRLEVSSMKKLRQDLFHSIRRLDVLQDLIEDPTITEIMINGAEHIFVERAGRIENYPGTFASVEKLDNVIQQIVAGCNRVVNASSPVVDARLPNGDRVNVVLAPVALNGPIVTIRRFPDHPISMEDLLRFGSVSEEIAECLRCLVQAGYNIFISGGTGSGKTTFLGAISAFIPETERVITIEDNAELQITHIPNMVRLEARNANVEGCVPVTIRDLIKASLRMRPDRIVVGEVRGPEAIDMIQAMNTGHDGSLSTGHANSAADMLARLETMILMGMDLPLGAIRGQLASGIDIIVHLGRLRDRSRRLLEVAEVTGMRDGQIKMSTIFRFQEEGEENGRIIGKWVRENELQNRGKIAMAGLSWPEERSGGKTS